MPRAELGVMRNFEVRLPRVREQQAIAAVLSDMDAEIAALETRRNKTHDLKQAMMQELLTGRRGGSAGGGPCLSHRAPSARRRTASSPCSPIRRGSTASATATWATGASEKTTARSRLRSYGQPQVARLSDAHIAAALQKLETASDRPVPRSTK